MNLGLSKRGDYVVRSAICLAKCYESGIPKKLRQVSSEMGVPRTYVSQILGDLARAGIANSFHGLHGGYGLSRPPAEICVLDVVEAGEGSLTPSTCVLGDEPCQWESVCSLHETWFTATTALRAVLANTSLAYLVERDQAIEGGTYFDLSDGRNDDTQTVEVADSVQVELPASTVAQGLRTGNSWLAPLVEAAHAENEANLVRIGPVGPAWSGKIVSVQLGTPSGDDEDLVLPVTWAANGPSGLFPRFEGEFHVAALDPDRTEVDLAGKYRPSLGPMGQALDEALLNHVAHATIRSFLRRIARGLEEHSVQ